MSSTDEQIAAAFGVSAIKSMLKAGIPVEEVQDLIDNSEGAKIVFSSQNIKSCTSDSMCSSEATNSLMSPELPVRQQESLAAQTLNIIANSNSHTGQSPQDTADALKTIAVPHNFPNVACTTKAPSGYACLTCPSDQRPSLDKTRCVDSVEYSGASPCSSVKQALLTIAGSQGSFNFGSSIATAIVSNVPYAIIGAPGVGDSLPSAVYVGRLDKFTPGTTVLSTDDALFISITSVKHNENLGYSVAAVTDSTGNYIILGAPGTGDTAAGAVYVGNLDDVLNNGPTLAITNSIFKKVMGSSTPILGSLGSSVGAAVTSSVTYVIMTEDRPIASNSIYVGTLSFIMKATSPLSVADLGFVKITGLTGESGIAIGIATVTYYDIPYIIIGSPYSYTSSDHSLNPAGIVYVGRLTDIIAAGPTVSITSPIFVKVNGANPGDQLGVSVAVATDVTGVYILMASPNFNGLGSVYVGSLPFIMSSVSTSVTDPSFAIITGTTKGGVFGSSIAVAKDCSGTYLIIGADRASSGKGAVSAVRMDFNNGATTLKLVTTIDGIAEEFVPFFGFSVANIKLGEKNAVIAGAAYDSASRGKVYILGEPNCYFESAPTSVMQQRCTNTGQALLTATGIGTSAQFGHSVTTAMAYGILHVIIGAPGNHGSANTGSVYISQLSCSTLKLSCTNSAFKQVSGSAPNDALGYSVAAIAENSDAYILIGSPGANNNNGAVFVGLLSKIMTSTSPVSVTSPIFKSIAGSGSLGSALAAGISSAARYIVMTEIGDATSAVYIGILDSIINASPSLSVTNSLFVKITELPGKGKISVGVTIYYDTAYIIIGSPLSHTSSDGLNPSGVVFVGHLNEVIANGPVVPITSLMFANVNGDKPGDQFGASVAVAIDITGVHILMAAPNSENGLGFLYAGSLSFIMNKRSTSVTDINYIKMYGFVSNGSVAAARDCSGTYAIVGGADNLGSETVSVQRIDFNNAANPVYLASVIGGSGTQLFGFSVAAAKFQETNVIIAAAPKDGGTVFVLGEPNCYFELPYVKQKVQQSKCGNAAQALVKVNGGGSSINFGSSIATAVDLDGASLVISAPHGKGDVDTGSVYIGRLLNDIASCTVSLECTSRAFTQVFGTNPQGMLGYNVVAITNRGRTYIIIGEPSAVVGGSGVIYVGFLDQIMDKLSPLAITDSIFYGVTGSGSLGYSFAAVVSLGVTYVIISEQSLPISSHIYMGDIKHLIAGSSLPLKDLDFVEIVGLPRGPQYISIATVTYKTVTYIILGSPYSYVSDNHDLNPEGIVYIGVLEDIIKNDYTVEIKDTRVFKAITGANPGDMFGGSLSTVVGDTDSYILMGAEGFNGGRGIVYLGSMGFILSSPSTIAVTNPNFPSMQGGVIQGGFGSMTAIAKNSHSTYAAIGAPRSEQAGAITITRLDFDDHVNPFKVTTTIKGTKGPVNGFFGSSIAVAQLDGENEIIIGAPSAVDPVTGLESGAVYVLGQPACDFEHV